MDNELNERNNFIMYTTDDGQVDIEVRLEEENVWLTQKSMAELFETTRNNITMHIKNIFEDGELQEKIVSKDSLLTAKDGKNYKTKFYNLDLIIAVGYRVKSVRGTQFRIWANKLIKEYLIKGYNLNVKRFKNNGGGTYFEEVLEKIRDIRSSEKVFWRKIEQIQKMDISRYCMKASDVFFLAELYNNNLFNASYSIFCFGFYQGMRYLKNQARKSK